MKLKSIILGIATTAVLITVLVATRMMLLTQAESEFEIREVETVTLPEPPPPPAEDPSEDETPPPPPPAIADLTPALDVSQPALPVVSVKVDPRIAVDTFFTDQPPSPLPQPVVKRPFAKPKPKATVKSPTRPKVKVTPPKPKSQYSLGELDKKPRLLRNPSVRLKSPSYHQVKPSLSLWYPPHIQISSPPPNASRVAPASPPLRIKGELSKSSELGL